MELFKSVLLLNVFRALFCIIILFIVCFLPIFYILKVFTRLFIIIFKRAFTSRNYALKNIDAGSLLHIPGSLGNPKGSQLVAKLEFNIGSEIDLESVKKLFLTRIISQYIEFRSRLVYYMGWAFWESFDSWSENDYFIEKKIKTQEELDVFEDKLLNEPINLFLYSPWQVVLVQLNNNENHTSILYFKFHHVLCDGYAIARVLAETSNKLPASIRTEAYTSLIWKRYLSILTFPYVFGNFLAQYLVLEIPYLATSHSWCKKTEEMSNNGISVKSKSIEFLPIKQFAQRNGLSITSIILGAIASGFEDALPLPALVVLPNIIFPKKNSMRIDSSAEPVLLPKLGGTLIALTELKSINESYLTIRNNFYSSFHHWLLVIVNVFPGRGKSFLQFPTSFALALSTLPLSTEPLEFLPGAIISNVSVTFTFGPTTGSQILMTTYNGKIQGNIYFNETICSSKSQAREIINKVMSNLEEISCSLEQI